ncbi:MAG: ribosome small subunit-dependent GTPase A [Candidatus Cloacimonetes bacterium]|nr:ribosome small subunit-dependent GTPase A [Candidatus Cloacimonadota bacterium]MCF7814991.1 ribosome small subunit-dependent GTPase A [Candidatus Cloacimonadota bacterium]MCF7868407.1 ribosome small subunit-dependent GTPase A [Candidatus Cloacimonadota bacterium]MCF7883880.1 ribosome small subunit-dependent GTPase A [Candidatus Cloacimonadota bacterium]
MKKKDKKKFKRQDMRFQNINIDDLEAFEEDEVLEDKRASKKLLEKGETSQKSNLELKKGRVLEVKSNNTCQVNFAGENIECILGGRLKQLNYDTRTLVAVGDYVNVDFSEKPRIEEILPRKNSLSRYSEENFQKEVILAANVDQVIITASAKEPDLNLGLIDRYICAGRIANIKTIICVNKIDLEKDVDELKSRLKFYRENDIKVIFTSIQTGKGMDKLKNILQNKESVFSGHSGVGKSSLINFLQPRLNLKVSEVSDYTSKGVHTTTSSKLIEWDFGGYLVDTPGIKTFGLHREDKEKIYRIFPGIDVLFNACKFADCSHNHEIGCAVKKAVENEEFPVERYQSYLRIIESL